MNNNNLLAWVIIAIVVIGGGWWLLSSNGGGASSGTGPIKIGVILPLTGDAATYGEPALNVYKLAVNEINNAGGVNGRPLQLVTEDGKCTGQDAASAAQKLVNVDNVQVILGGFCSGESLAAVPIAAQAKVALFSGGSSSPKLTDASPYFSRDYPSDATQGKVLADVAYNDKGWRKIAFIQEQTDYAQGVYDAFSQEFQKLGGTVTNDQFTTGTTDFRSVVTKIRDAKPDAVFVDTQTAAAANRVLTQITQLGWTPKILLSDVTMGDPPTLEANKTLLQGALGAEFGVDPSNPKYAALVSSYKSTYGSDMPYQSYGQTEYDAVYLIKDAIAAVGYNGTKIANWLHDVNNWQGASGSITIGASGDPVAGHRPEVVIDGAVQPYTK
jgi:branched-chain amino acid transport system substrate-binding protein